MNTSLRAIIADDERLAREKLRVLLGREPDVTIVAECQSGAETLAAVREHAPDLLFLDVRMPDLDGLAVLDRLAVDPMPALVFTTAYDQYAIDAFEANATDYLLKPFDAQRLRRAVDKVRAMLDRPHSRAAHRPSGSRHAAGARGEATVRQRIMVKSAGRIVFLDPADIDWVEAAANYVRLHVGAASYLLRESISRMSERLDARFARIHRSTIVNVGRIRELKPCESGEYLAILESGKVLSCSRSYRSEVHHLMSGAH